MPHSHKRPAELRSRAVARAVTSTHILDYDGAISRFESVLKTHPQDPMAYGLVQMATRLPRSSTTRTCWTTTYYAHELVLS